MAEFDHLVPRFDIISLQIDEFKKLKMLSRNLIHAANLTTVVVYEM